MYLCGMVEALDHGRYTVQMTSTHIRAKSAAHTANEEGLVDG